MRRRIAALMGAWVCLSGLYIIGFLLFGPLFANEVGASSPLVPFFVGFVISNALLILFFAWVAEQMGHAIKAGLTVAVSQLLLVNVNYVLTGSRTFIAGAASSIVLLVAWPVVGLVYKTILGRQVPGGLDPSA